MRILLSDGCLYHLGTEEIFEIASKTGFDGVELIWGNRTGGVAVIREAMERYNIPVPVLHEPFWNWRLPGWPNEPERRFPYIIEAAEQIGAEKIVVHAAIDAPYIAWQKENLPLVQKKTRILLAVENMPEEMLPFAGFLKGLFIPLRRKFYRIYPSTFPDFLKKMLRCIDYKDYSINRADTIQQFDWLTMDTTHLGTAGTDVLAYYTKLAHKITHIHFSDFDGKEHRMPGFGRLPLKELLKYLSDTGYTGTLTLEVNPRAFCNSFHKSAAIDELAEVMSWIKENL